MEKDVFRLVSSETQRKSSVKNRTSDLRIPRADALPLSHKDSMVSKALYKVHIIGKFDPIRYLIVSQYELSKLDKDSQLLLRM